MLSLCKEQYSSDKVMDEGLIHRVLASMSEEESLN